MLGVCVVRYAQITQNNKFRSIQFLRFHKITKIWTPPPRLLSLHLHPTADIKPCNFYFVS